MALCVWLKKIPPRTRRRPIRESKQPFRPLVTVKMLSRLALRQATIRMAAAKASGRTAAAPASFASSSFHSSAARKDEEKKPAAEAVHPGLLTQYGLDDWKISAPIIGAISIPVLSNGVRPCAFMCCCYGPLFALWRGV